MQVECTMLSVVLTPLHFCFVHFFLSTFPQKDHKRAGVSVEINTTYLSAAKEGSVVEVRGSRLLLISLVLMTQFLLVTAVLANVCGFLF